MTNSSNCFDSEGDKLCQSKILGEYDKAAKMAKASLVIKSKTEYLVVLVDALTFLETFDFTKKQRKGGIIIREIVLSHYHCTAVEKLPIASTLAELLVKYIPKTKLRDVIEKPGLFISEELELISGNVKPEDAIEYMQDIATAYNEMKQREIDEQFRQLEEIRKNRPKNLASEPSTYPNLFLEDTGSFAQTVNAQELEVAAQKEQKPLDFKQAYGDKAEAVKNGQMDILDLFKSMFQEECGEIIN
ncbi:MAG: hypothetical protein MHMPM18_003251 [Marteilia pararefringens]